eukprot:TRINITY_DN2256_c0_g1_i2.p1 TRINITY_DN2256_c0_g1~~TRINITY_DN2256_c0_g1_i2.p1  ORF type:complete len:466 (-),score=99.89 TRINITY_DN2256_c0_g1_i2:514-1911(-)
MVTFLVTHFNDARIANPDVRDLLLQCISLLLQTREFVIAFERNRVACERLPAALLTAFDNRFWIPVAHVLHRLLAGGGSRGTSAGSGADCSSAVFQELLRMKCLEDEPLISSFLNRLFNTLTWTVTEFSVAAKEVQDAYERRQVLEAHYRKCTVMYDLSCVLLRLAAFLASHLPQLFLAPTADTSLARLCELLLFVLSHTTTGETAEVLFQSPWAAQLYSATPLPQRSAILGPVVAIVTSLVKAPPGLEGGGDIVRALASIDSSPNSSAITSFDYLLLHKADWLESLKGSEIHQQQLRQLPGELRAFVKRLKLEVELVVQAAAREAEEATARRQRQHQLGEREDGEDSGSHEDSMDHLCSICYARDIDTAFVPCKHESCRRCIARSLLNSPRCFFCNANIEELLPLEAAIAQSTYSASSPSSGAGPTSAEALPDGTGSSSPEACQPPGADNSPVDSLLSLRPPPF